MNGIGKTKDYSKFKILTGNRSLRKSHISNLTVSIIKKNMLAQNPILVNEAFEVIDGQHRLEVAKNNNLEIYYLILPQSTIEETISLNANNRMWTINDYIRSFAERGNSDYQWLLKFIYDNQISPTAALILLYEREGGWSRQYIQSGKLELAPSVKKRGQRRVEILNSIRSYLKWKGLLPKSFLQAINFIDNENLAENIINKIEIKGIQIVPAGRYNEDKAQLLALLK